MNRFIFMPLVLDTLPSPTEFFRDYWNKKPFVVRGMIPKDTSDGLIDEDYLAGLSMEEEVKSRLVKKGETQSDWTCDLGPFEETVFADLGAKDWSLLVQNIDQYHDETAELLKHFNFCPRWLLDDIMVSYSPKGGTVGAHTDSYHVFLVQGKGKRCWTVAHEAIHNEAYIQDIPLKILETPFQGEDITVSEGDVIYIPPKFAHQGISLEPSLTYSVGFLGPSLSEMLIDFGHYIEENHLDIPRYLGQNLTESAAPFEVAPAHISDFKKFMIDVFDEDYFARWLTQYFSAPIHPFEDDEEDAPIDAAKIAAENALLIKPPSIKIMFTPLKTPNQYCITVGAVSFDLKFDDLALINAMAQEIPFSANIFKGHIETLQNLLDGNALFLAEM